MARMGFVRLRGSIVIVLLGLALTSDGCGDGGEGSTATAGSGGSAVGTGGRGGGGGSTGGMVGRGGAVGGSTAGVGGMSGSAGAAGAGGVTGTGGVGGVSGAGGVAGIGGAAGAGGVAGTGGGAGGAGGRGGASGGSGGSAGTTGGSAGAGGSGGSAAGTSGSGGSAGAGGSGGSAAGTSGSGGSAGAGGSGGSAGAGGSGGSAGASGSGGSAGDAGTGGGNAGTGGGSGGNGGSGGSAGTGGGCTPTGAESCFNGVDDDCDGNVDCADADCTPVAECVPEATGFELGTTVDPAVGCPAHFGAGATSLNQGLNAPATCNGCTLTTSLSCSATASEISATGTCPRGTATLTGNTANLNSNTCYSQNGALNWTTGNVVLSAITAIRACVVSGTPSPGPVAWQAQTKFCATQELGRGCAAGNRCVSKLGAGKHCVAVAGTMTCPGGYAPQGALPWYTGVQDSRTCGSTCLPGTPSGGSCGTAVVRSYANTSCTGPFDTLLPSQDACFLNSPIHSFAVVPSGVTQPTCTLLNTVTGAATPTGPQTLCCL